MVESGIAHGQNRFTRVDSMHEKKSSLTPIKALFSLDRVDSGLAHDLRPLRHIGATVAREFFG